MDTYADDLATLVEALDLRNAIHVGHSTGGGEVARYLGRHGTQRVAKAVLISAVPPLMPKTAANPGGTPIEEFDKLRSAVQADRSQFWKDLSMPFYGYNRPGAKISEGVRESFWFARNDSGVSCFILLHQGVFRDGSHRGSQEIRRTDADPARRRRPDRADRRLGDALVEDRQGRRPEGSGCAPVTGQRK